MSGFVATAGRAGAAWAGERDVARAMASAARAASDPGATVELARLARHASWRGEQWYSVLPTQPGIDPSTLGGLPEGWADPTPDLMAGAEGIARVLRRLEALAVGVLAELDDVADAPTGRAARRVLADLALDLDRVSAAVSGP